MKNIQRGMKYTLDQIMKQHHVIDYNDLMHQVYNDPEVQSFLKAHKNDMSKDDLVRAAPRLNEFVQERNNVKSGKSGLMPGYVPHLVMNGHSISVEYQPTKQTAELRQERIMRDRVHSVAVPKRDRDASLDDFDNSSDNTRLKIWTAANHFINSYESSPDQYHQGMYIWGPVGVGKTFLLAAMANRLARDGFETSLVHFPTFSVEMKASIHDYSTARKIRSIEQSPILMLDDIGANVMSAWIRDDIFSVILEYRMQNEMPTFFSSNVSMKDFAKNHLTYDNRGDEDPLNAKRIMERVRFLAKEYEMNGINRRNPEENK